MADVAVLAAPAADEVTEAEAEAEESEAWA
jgi:hypothetical protein